MERQLLFLLAEQIEGLRVAMVELTSEDRAYGRLPNLVSHHLDEAQRRTTDIAEAVAEVEKALGDDRPCE